MLEGVGEERFFWDTYPWVMPGNSSGRSSGGDHEMVATIVGGGNKENGDTLEVKKEIKTEDDTEASPHSNKAKRELEPSDHDLHILIERERRKKMRNLFHQLHALLPQLPHKVDKATVVDEAINYIKTQEQTLQKLETKKLEMPYGQSTKITGESFLADQGSSSGNIGKVSASGSTSLSFPLNSPKVFQTWISSNVTLNVCGKDAQIAICSVRKPGLLTAICFVLEKYKLEIVSAEISSDEYKSLFMIHAQAKACDKFMETFHYDEIYKQAASEITHWVNS
ncbi:transcription factor bHLH95-like [Bidens hawaiensis]|uniref:transcription factor bHLH95-like n=1 Tax=Bidens hawaiensis TaxID=980011 RepID=UPI00404A8304